MEFFDGQRNLSVFEKIKAHRLFLVFKYGVSGCVGATIQLSVDYVWVEYVHGSYLVATAGGFVIALIVSFVLQKYWTFGDTARSRIPHQLFFYVIIALGSLAGNVALMHFFVDTFGIWYMLAQLYTIVIVTALSFVCNNLITFKEHNFFKKT